MGRDSTLRNTRYRLQRLAPRTRLDDFTKLAEIEATEARRAVPTGGRGIAVASEAIVARRHVMEGGMMMPQISV